MLQNFFCVLNYVEHLGDGEIETNNDNDEKEEAVECHDDQ